MSAELTETTVAHRPANTLPDMLRTPEDLVKECRAGYPNFPANTPVHPKLQLPFLHATYLLIPKKGQSTARAPMCTMCWPSATTKASTGYNPYKTVKTSIQPEEGFTKGCKFTVMNCRTGSGATYEGFGEETEQKEERTARQKELEVELKTKGPLAFYNAHCIADDETKVKQQCVVMNFAGFFDKNPGDPNSRKTTDEEKMAICTDAIYAAVVWKPCKAKGTIVWPSPDTPGGLASEYERALALIDKRVLFLLNEHEEKVWKYYKRAIIGGGSKIAMADEVHPDNSFLHSCAGGELSKTSPPWSSEKIAEKFHGLVQRSGKKDDPRNYNISKFHAKTNKLSLDEFGVVKFTTTSTNPKWSDRMRMMNELDDEARAIFMKKTTLKRDLYSDIDTAKPRQKDDSDLPVDTRKPIAQQGVFAEFCKFEWNRYGKFQHSIPLSRIDCWAGSMSYTSQAGISAGINASCMVRGNLDFEPAIPNFDGPQWVVDNAGVCRYLGFLSSTNVQDEDDSELMAAVAAAKAAKALKMKLTADMATDQAGANSEGMPVTTQNTTGSVLSKDVLAKAANIGDGETVNENYDYGDTSI